MSTTPLPAASGTLAGRKRESELSLAIFQRDLEGRDGGDTAEGFWRDQLLAGSGRKSTRVPSHPEEHTGIEKESHPLYSSGQSSGSRGREGSSWKTIFPKVG